MQARASAITAGGATPPAVAAGSREAPKVRVWDPFVRIFHWSLVALVIGAFLTGDHFEKVHVVLGYGVAALVALRIGWGFVGTRHARFANFVRPVGESLRYLVKAAGGRAPRHLGHNPAGAWMIVALLAMLAAVAATGFMMTTDTFWGAQWVEDLHEGLAYALLGLVALHIAGVLFASYMHGENLVRAMFSGRKRAA